MHSSVYRKLKPKNQNGTTSEKSTRRKVIEKFFKFTFIHSFTESQSYSHSTYFCHFYLDKSFSFVYLGRFAHQQQQLLKFLSKYFSIFLMRKSLFHNSTSSSTTFFIQYFCVGSAVINIFNNNKLHFCGLNVAIIICHLNDQVFFRQVLFQTVKKLVLFREKNVELSTIFIL